MHIEVTQNTKKLRLLMYVLELRSSLFLVELGVGIWSHSLSLIAGSGHLFSDLVSLGLTVLVTWLVQRRSIGEVTSRYQRVEGWVAFLNLFDLLGEVKFEDCYLFTHERVLELEFGLRGDVQYTATFC